MFGIFKRTKIKDEEIKLLQNVLVKLPFPYSHLINQINDGLFRGVLIDASDIPGYVAFTFNSNVLKKYDRENERDFKLCNIKVYDRKTLSYLPYEIYVSSGTINGYSLGGNKKYDIDTNKIDVTGFRKTFFGIVDYQKIENLLSEKEKMILNPSEVYSVFINNREYFHIKDLEDGNFIGIDLKKNIYKIIHNPSSIEMIDETIESILS
ncbi:hypothetical protein D0809_03365 [Flavobacterium circumlabens]|uniref:Uncharacterized protein n=1 Tax=Flavobacterium circumlabens TaxID=2133765 RepID=A0A4Y7UI48_9FLAO|nr:hypothetical protein [Flavobacterium circumlabens]TCN60927.1 hypothetical protein EV142_101506 [Flavobacterium circumlabens]TEB46046.1 hypothetical protein D0809_03365 [Flavobacterium circumlabens]